MNTQETQALLAYISATDPRVRRNDPDERRLQTRAWHTALTNTHPQDAIAAADEHYARPNPPAALPGDIAGRAQAISNHRRRDNLERHGHQLEAATLQGVDPDDPAAYLAALRTARRRAAEGELPPPDPAHPERPLNLDGVFRAIPPVHAGRGAS